MATTSPAKIGNLALSHIGDSSTVENISTENSTEAKQLDLWYDFARRQALGDLDWGFARKRIQLSLHSDDAPEPDWSYRYMYPSDAIAIRRIVNPLGMKADPVPFQVEPSEDGASKTILTNVEDAKALYTHDLKSTSLFSPSFIIAFSYLLAHYIAFTLTGKTAIEDRMFQKYLMALRVAEAIDKNESMDDAPREAEWIRGRA